MEDCEAKNNENGDCKYYVKADESCGLGKEPRIRDVVEREAAKLDAVAGILPSKDIEFVNMGGLASIIEDSVEKIKEAVDIK